MKLAHELHKRECTACGLSRPVFEFAQAGDDVPGLVCRACVSGRQRLAALGRRSPIIAGLTGDARRCAVQWETARLCLKRYLARQGVRVTVQGVALVIEEPRAPSSAELSSRP